jgi:hypothetical protein
MPDEPRAAKLIQGYRKPRLPDRKMAENGAAGGNRNPAALALHVAVKRFF